MVCIYCSMMPLLFANAVTVSQCDGWWKKKTKHTRTYFSPWHVGKTFFIGESTMEIHSISQNKCRKTVWMRHSTFNIQKSIHNLQNIVCVCVLAQYDICDIEQQQKTIFQYVKFVQIWILCSTQMHCLKTGSLILWAEGTTNGMDDETNILCFHDGFLWFFFFSSMLWNNSGNEV